MPMQTKNEFDLSEKIAVVTGAGRGLGHDISLALARYGAHVVVCSRTESELETVVEKIKAMGKQAISVPMDVSDIRSIRPIVDRAVETFGRIDILVNNAGINRPQRAEDVAEDNWDQVMNTNLKGLFFCAQAVGRVMISQKKGKIINVSSVAGKMGDITSAPGYGPSKAAIDAFTKTLARQLAPYGINVNGVAPHAIETEMSSQWSPERRKAIIDAIPLKRLGQPEDVAEAVLFLASEKANFITGEILDVNGGFFMD